MAIITTAPGPSLTINGRTFTDLTNLIQLSTLTSAGGNNGTFRKIGASVGYQVPAGKKFVVHVVRVANRQTTATHTTQPALRQSDNDVGLQTATAFTGDVLAVGSSLVAVISSTPFLDMAIVFTVAAGKYVSMGDAGGQTTTHYAWGYEENA